MGDNMKIEPQIEEAQALKKHILSELKAKYERERIGIHATDLLWPRLAVFRKLESQELNERDLLYFALGHGEGEVIEALISDRSEVVVIDSDIIHTIDAIVFEGGRPIPVEIKTTRSKSGDLVKPHYLLQLALYCLALTTNYGYLVILKLNDDEKPLHAYRITFSEEELGRLFDWREKRRDLIIKALEQQNPSLALCCWKDPILGWKCKFCPFQDKCREIEEERPAIRAEAVYEGFEAVKIPLEHPIPLGDPAWKKFLKPKVLELHKKKYDIDYAIAEENGRIKELILLVPLKCSRRHVEEIKRAAKWAAIKVKERDGKRRVFPSSSKNASNSAVIRNKSCEASGRKNLAYIKGGEKP